MFDHPVIAAVRRSEDLNAVLESPVTSIFLMYGDLSTLASTVARLQAGNKTVYLHIDLVKGLGSDKEAVDYVAAQVAPTGIVTTKGHLIKEIRRAGLVAVHQLFLIDTQAFQTAVKSVTASQPDLVEIMPGLMPRVVREWKTEVPLPLVAAGFIRSEAEIRTMLNAGCDGVAVGDHLLWNTGPWGRP